MPTAVICRAESAEVGMGFTSDLYMVFSPYCRSIWDAAQKNGCADALGLVACPAAAALHNRYGAHFGIEKQQLPPPL